MHKYNLIMQAYIVISQSMISSLANIHDNAYAHITTCINISQEFKHINHGDIFISKSCISQNQSRKWYSIKHILIKHSFDQAYQNPLSI